jgi:outer membrane protein assembly factor BamA
LIRARLRCGPRLSVMLGSSMTYNRIGSYPGSKLADDLADDDLQLDALLHGTDSHLLAVLDAGLLWDSRDHDLVPSRGVLHEVSARAAQGFGADARYLGTTVALRFFRSLIGRRLVLASRLLTDLLWGQPPVYELARHGGLLPMPAPGGGSAVRGVPPQRYHGPIKFVGNLELRGRLLPFRWLGQVFELGAVIFVDIGRVWTGTTTRRRFDGSGLGLKLGTGGGARVKWGEALLLRADLAWSPDANPVGAYFNVNHVF